MTGSEATLERKLFIGFICFAVLFYAISALFGGGTVFKINAPAWLLLSRDFLYIGFLVFLWIRLGGRFAKETWPEYAFWFKGFILLALCYVILALLHAGHRNFFGILQHELRNTIGYSGFLFFLPLLAASRADWRRILNTFLALGVFQAAYAIASRYSGSNFMTWEGRVTGTMADPNNFSVFMAFCVFVILIQWENFKSALRWPLLCVFVAAFTMAGSITGLGVLMSGMGLIWLAKGRALREFFACVAIVYCVFFFSNTLKIIENRELPAAHVLSAVVSIDRYLTDKLDNFSMGKFSRIFFFGLAVNPDDPARTLTRRWDQTAELSASMGNINPKALWLGDFGSTNYRRFDSQYLNLFWNTGILSLIIIVAIFSPAFYLGLRNWRRRRDEVSLTLWVFLVSLFAVGFNGSALLNRFPLNFISYLSLGAIVILSREKDSALFK